jgi:hypothetical protein
MVTRVELRRWVHSAHFAPAFLRLGWAEAVANRVVGKKISLFHFYN